MHHFMIKVPHRSSACIEVMYVDPIRGIVDAAYQRGNVYRYTSVSRRAIANLLLNPTISLGIWANKYLTFCGSKCAKFGTCTKLSSVIYASQLPYGI